MKELIKKGIRTPKDIPQGIYSIFLLPYYNELKYEIYRNINNISKQTRLVDEFVTQTEFVLIILDACRFDYFQRQYEEYLSGELSAAWSPANRTPVWVPHMWNDYYELTYVSGSPFISSNEYNKNRQNYRATDHFDNIIELWDDELKTATPNDVKKAALNVAASDETTRMVVHFMQPHKPYIGGDDSYDIDFSGFHDVNVTNKKLEQAYRDNLDHVLPHVKQLISQVDCPVVVTSDHGELLGENGEYLHNPAYRTYNPILRKVPWLNVDENIIGTKEIESPDDFTNMEAENYNFEEQLSHLGYK
jgi:hypothetical protein